MAKKRTEKTNQKKTDPTALIKSRLPQDLSSQLRLGESYISLVLGAVVVFGLSVVLFLFIKESGLQGANPTINETSIPATVTQITSQKTYVLQSGEGLWDVAVKFYGDGYRWVDIAKANGLENNPDNIEPGTKLIIPNLK